MTDRRLIETDYFPFEFLSRLAQRESWRKEAFRPIYYLHKWWAKRLGSVFRGILLGSVLPESANLAHEFYNLHSFSKYTVFDPFMGSGVTIGESHKLGFTTLGRDINPVAFEIVRVALGPLNKSRLEDAFTTLSQTVGKKILAVYRSEDSRGRIAESLYYFWVMQTNCPNCGPNVDIFPSWIIAKNAYPNRKPVIQILCPSCNAIFTGIYGQKTATCTSCGHTFSPVDGTSAGSKTICTHCGVSFSIVKSFRQMNSRPHFRLYGKLILDSDGRKGYLPASDIDEKRYQSCSIELVREIEKGNIQLPTLRLELGYNTRQAMNYGFLTWRDFFNDRQLLALGWLQSAIATTIEDKSVRDVLLLIFSGTLEFNNMFASYKGEGTGAVRHMFAHHILKPAYVPIEANVWGTPKSSGSFSTLFQRRLLGAIEYRNKPTEFDLNSGKRIVCAPPFSGRVESLWPTEDQFEPGAIYLSSGDSNKSGLQSKSIDIIVTDPPFFDNVHYSELADFFYAWQQLYGDISDKYKSTRDSQEVQDSDPYEFTRKLQLVMDECERTLKDEGLMVFTYHHSRYEGWLALAIALQKSGFVPVNAHPVKSEMSVATPKSQTKEPIQLDNIIVCKKSIAIRDKKVDVTTAVETARLKLKRLEKVGLRLSRNDLKVVYYGQLLTANTESGIKELPYFDFESIIEVS